MAREKEEAMTLKAHLEEQLSVLQAQLRAKVSAGGRGQGEPRWAEPR